MNTEQREQAEALMAIGGLNEEIALLARTWERNQQLDVMRHAVKAISSLLARLRTVEQATCDHGCGPGDYIGGLGFGIVPACPVHGWVCGPVDALLARLSAVEQRLEAKSEDYMRAARLVGKANGRMLVAEARAEAAEQTLRDIRDALDAAPYRIDRAYAILDAARAVLAPSQQEEK